MILVDSYTKSFPVKKYLKNLSVKTPEKSGVFRGDSIS
jgi:hypothetical protein